MSGHHIGPTDLRGKRYTKFQASARCSCGMRFFAESADPAKARRKLNRKTRVHKAWGKLCI